MTRHLFKFLSVALLIVSCEKHNVDPNYPTTLKVVPSATLSQMRESFSSKNRYLVTSVNEFGFCDYLDDLLPVGTPPVHNALTESEAIEIVKNFASNNAFETGVKNLNDLTFSKKSTDTRYGGAIGWHFKSSYQKVDTIEVLYSLILFHITNGEMTSVVGNWFPDIYIPKQFNIDQEKAKASLVGKVVSHSNFAGQAYYVTISKTDIDKSTPGLKIVPIKTDEKIELRVGWLINIPGPVYYKIYVDVMTGDIIGQEPTIIS